MSIQLPNLTSGWMKKTAQGALLIWMAAILAVHLILTEPRVYTTRLGGKIHLLLLPLLTTPPRQP